MSAEDVINQIEHGTVFERLMTANTSHDILRRLEESPQLADAIKTQEVDALLGRACEVYSREEPAGYAHTGDLALCAYAYVLAQIAPVTARPLLRRLAGESPQRFPAAAAVAREMLL